MKTDGKAAFLRQAQVAEPNEADLGKLVRLIAAYAPHDGTFELRLPGLCASRFFGRAPTRDIATLRQDP